MSRVFVVNFSGHNIYPAKQYGDIVVLTEGKANIFNVDRMKYDFLVEMKDITKDDYILLAGSPILNALACMISMHKIGECNVLIYDAKDGVYAKRNITEKSIFEIGELVKEQKDGKLSDGKNRNVSSRARKY
jgi:hypothetical protein